MHSAASAVRQLNVRVAASFGVAALATVVTMRWARCHRPGPNDIGAAAAQNAYNPVFLSVSTLATVAAMLGALLPGTKRNRQILDDRTREHEVVVDPV